MGMRKIRGELGAQGGAVGKAAGGEHHAQASPQLAWPLRRVYAGADDAAALLHQRRQRRGQPDARIGATQVGVHPRHQRVAVGDERAARIAAQPVAQMPQHTLHHPREGRERGQRPNEARHVVGPEHHAAEHQQVADRRPHLLEVLAESATVVGPRLERPAAREGTGRLAVVVGHVDEVEGHIRLLERQQRRHAVREVGVDQILAV